MLSSAFDVFGFLDRLKETAGPFLPEYGGIFAMIAATVVLVRIGIKVLSGGKAGGGSVNIAPVNAEKASDSADVSAGKPSEENGGEKQNDQERQKEEERLKTQEQLKELFELFDEGKEKPVELEKTQDDKELESLGLERKDLEELKEQHKELVVEIAALLEKGMTSAQTAKALVARTTEQIPMIELRPLIEAMECFLRKNEEMEKDTAVIGMDPLFEQKAAFSALKRGDYEAAFDYLERRAEEAENTAESSRREDVRTPALQEAAELYLAIGVLARPIDPEKSFDSLKKSKEFDCDNALTDVLLGQAYYESGKTKKAENLFEEALENSEENDYTAQYAMQMAAQIKTQRTLLHAQRIREEYEKRLEETEGRQMVVQNVPLHLRKKAEINRAVGRFVAEEVHERGNERNIL